MRTSTRKSFNSRAFVALAAAISGLGLPLTGIMNHVYQSAVIAGPREAWMAIHWTLGTIFTVSAFWHVILNRRALLKYAKGLIADSPKVSREMFLATGIITMMSFLAASHAFHP